MLFIGLQLWMTSGEISSDEMESDGEDSEDYYPSRQELMEELEDP
jgi:hypothetical protein